MRSFIFPHLPSVLLCLIMAIFGVIGTNLLFAITESLKLVTTSTGLLICAGSLLYYLKQKRIGLYFIIIAIAGVRTLSTLTPYLHALNNSSTPLTITDIYETGNKGWPFCIELENPNSCFAGNALVFAKRKPTCSIGDTCLAKADFKKVRYNSFCRFLLRRGIYSTAFVYNFKPTVLTKQQPSLQSWVHKKRETLCSSLYKKCSKRTAALFASLYTGDKKPFKRTLHKTSLHFRSWGIVHHLARSGIHLIIMMALFYFLFSFIPLHYNIKVITLSLLCVLLTLFSFPSVSFIRALCAFILAQLFFLKRRQLHSCYIVILIALIFLAYSPFLLFSLDFQLSFFVTFLISLFSLVSHQKKLSGCKLLLTDYKKQ